MFDIAPSEMLVVALVAIIFIGPKDLPRVMRVVGQWVGRGRAMARHFRTAMDDMVREAELAEMEQKWQAENQRIMREHAALLDAPPTAELPAAERPTAELPAAAPAARAPASAETHPAPAAAAPEPPRPASVGERG